MRKGLAGKIVLLMVISSACLSLVATGFQLYFSYQRDVKSVYRSVEAIESSFRDGLENALWQFNFEQIEALLDGIMFTPDVAGLKLTVVNSQSFERGDIEKEDTKLEVFTLFYNRESGEQVPVGELSVWMSFDNANARLLEQFLTLLFSNFLKTMLASFIMYVIFDRFVSRKLRSIASQVNSGEWPRDGAQIKLHDQPVNEENELDIIVSQLNSAGQRIVEANRQVELKGNQTKQVLNELELVLNSATSGILALDMAGKIVRINRRGREILGDVTETPPFDWPQNAKFFDAQTMQPLMADETPVQLALMGHRLRDETYVIRRSERNEYNQYVRIQSTLLDISAYDIVTVLVIDDISNEERNRKVIERQGRLDALGQLTGGIAHDFNNILASLLYSVELSKKSDDKERREKFLSIALSSINKGRELTGRLLSFAKRQPGMAVSKNINHVFDGFDELIRPLVEKNVELTLHRSNGDVYVYCDHIQLETALLNLVLNSRDAIEKDGKGSRIDITTRLVQSLDSAREPLQSKKTSYLPGFKYVEISVTDDGPGMNKDTALRSIDPFFSTKDDASGTGLGLSMVYGFAQQSEGDLRVYSELGIGTTVQLILPIGNKVGEREANIEQITPEIGNGQTVLLVEDEMHLLEITSAMLQSLNYIVVEASSAEQALQLIDDGQEYDLLLTDVMMPGGLGGFELAEVIREKSPDMPVVYISGYSGFSSHKTGAVKAPFLQKPASTIDLAETIANALKSLDI